MWLNRKPYAVSVALIGLVLLAAGTVAAEQNYYGGLYVLNNSDHMLQIFIDGNPVGQIASGVGRGFSLLPGAHEVSAHDEYGRSVERDVRISQDETVTWNVGPIRPPGPIRSLGPDREHWRYGWLEVINRFAHHALHIFVDDEPVGMVAPNDRRTFRLDPGSYRVTAHGGRGLSMGRYADIYRGATTFWRLGWDREPE